MAYNRAPRDPTDRSTTNPNVAPNTYEINYDFCYCKGTNWAPFLSSSSRHKTHYDSTPAPNAYYPKTERTILGGGSLSYKEPRFKGVSYETPGPNEYDPYHTSKELSEVRTPRLKGFMYFCHVPFTLFGYPPTIPNPQHMGYTLTKDKVLVECCIPDHDTTLGPAYYDVKYETCGACYRGSNWSKYSRRKIGEVLSDTPGVGSYDIQPQKSQMEEYSIKLRHERKKYACLPRYVENLQSQAIRDGFPAPNQYTIEKIKLPRPKKKLVPKRIVVEKKIVCEPKRSPAPNQYTDPRTAFEFLVKPSCREGFSAFLTNAPRFQRTSTERRPGPNEYYIAGFVEELHKKVSPYAVRNTAFNTSIPKKLYFLPPEYPIQHKKTCKCSEKPIELPKPPIPPPVHPFASKTKRFRDYTSSYDANCASYNIQPSFDYLKAKKSFRRSQEYHFLFGEERFSRLTNFNAVEDKSYVPGLKYDLLKFIPGATRNNSGSFGKALRFSTKVDDLPGPQNYKIKSKIRTTTFNVTLSKPNRFTPLQKYRMRLQRRGKGQRRDFAGQRKKTPECQEVQLVNIEFQPKNKVLEKNQKKGGLASIKN